MATPVDERKARIIRLVEFIKGHQEDKFKKIVALFCFQTGLRKKTVLEMLNPLIEGELIKFDKFGNLEEIKI